MNDNLIRLTDLERAAPFVLSDAERHAIEHALGHPISPAWSITTTCCNQ